MTNKKIKKQNWGGKKNLDCSLAIIIIISTGFIIPANAVDLNAHLNTQLNAEKPSFQFVRVYEVDYPNGGQLKDLLNGKNMTVAFQMDPNSTSKKAILEQINKEMLNLQSAVIVSDVDISYEATLTGTDKWARIDYKIVLTPTVTNYVIRHASGDTAAILDVGWRGLAIKDPVIVNTSQYGNFDINSPISFVKKQFPDLYAKIQGTEAEDLLNDSMIDSSELTQDPISKWQHLFDPAYTIVETSDFGYKGQKVTISTYATGQSNISQGAMLPTIKRADFKLDQDYNISYTERASTASVQIDGYVDVAQIGDTEYFGSISHPVGGQAITSTGNYPVQVIYSMGALGAVLAAGILFWSNRKLKTARNRKPDDRPRYPIEYEERRHWADRFEDRKDKSS